MSTRPPVSPALATFAEADAFRALCYRSAVLAAVELRPDGWVVVLVSDDAEGAAICRARYADTLASIAPQRHRKG